MIPRGIDLSWDKVWWQNGKPHRIDGPAIEHRDGSKYWMQFGKHHRTDGPAIELANGDRYWYQYGLLHRTDGPAIMLVDGRNFWYQNNGRHRIGGPAAEYINFREWWVEGKYIKSCYLKTVSYIRNKGTENEEEMEIELCCKECAKLYHNMSEEEFEKIK